MRQVVRFTMLYMLLDLNLPVDNSLVCTRVQRVKTLQQHSKVAFGTNAINFTCYDIWNTGSSPDA